MIKQAGVTFVATERKTERSYSADRNVKYRFFFDSFRFRRFETVDYKLKLCKFHFSVKVRLWPRHYC